MTNLEQNILKTLAKAKNFQTDPYLSLNAIWQESGAPKIAQFAHAWKTLEYDEFVTGHLNTTVKGEQELAKLEES